MSAEAIYKLEPHRTMHLQGFDGYGCTACLHDASAAGFTVSGIWAEQGDFAVLVLWDADNQFEHPRMRYLPDLAFDGMTLSFGLAMTGCVPLDSDYFRWIDWGQLNLLFGDGTTQQIALSDCATPATGGYAPAQVVFTLTGSITGGDYIELAWLTQHINYYVLGTDTLATAAAGLVSNINTFGDGSVYATATGATIWLTWMGYTGAPLVGLGANANGRIGVYGTVFGAQTEVWSPASATFSGGASPTAFNLSIDFSLRVIQAANIQRMWITLAPPISVGTAFVGGAWSAVFTSWAVTDTLTPARRPLKVAGPGSVRIEETSPWVVRAGYWEAAPADGFAFWSQGLAIRSAWSAVETRKLTIETHCGAVHDIYVGTRLDWNCGQVSASLDGGAAVTLDCYGAAGAQVRRRLFAGVAAGQHSVTITMLSTKNVASGGWYFYFDFLECAVLGDVPDAPATTTAVGVATDFDTNNTYMLSPARLLWDIQRMGLVGEIDHYMGVFWWPVRKCLTSSATWAQVTTITLSGAPVWGQTFYVNLGGTALSHMCLIGDTLATVALAFAQLINQGSTTMRAAAAGAVLTLTGLAGESQYHMTVTAPTAAGITTAVSTVNGAAVAVNWGVDETAAAPVNGAVAAWCSDFLGLVHAAGMGAVVSFSQELVNPPAAWVQCFHDGTRVETATGFGTLSSSQMGFGAAMAAYMTAAYAQMAGLMVAAGVTPRLQFGEVGWWFQAGGTPASMAFYDADTTAAAVAVTGLGRALATFAGPASSAAVNGYADANFLRARLGSYVAGVQAGVLALRPTAVFEVLWPLDVNDPVAAPLCRYVNLPTAWMTRAGSGFDTFVCEGLSYAGVNHNVDEARACAGYPFVALSWDAAHCRYLEGWYYSGWPWVAEFVAALGTGVPLIKFWAIDHLCLFGWDLPLPGGSKVAAVLRGVVGA
jgi:hypothetical protein